MQKIERLTDLEDAIKFGTSTFKIYDFWWRGQPIDKPLIPSVFRRDDAEHAESGLAKRFIQKAPSRHSQCPPTQDHTGWLFLMTHFGLPTRILDWTESILIATYFAVNKDVSSSGVVWALNPFLLNEIQFGQPAIATGYRNDIEPIIAGAFSGDSADCDKVVAMRPAHNNLRMMLQQSTFTMHGSGKPLEDFPQTEKCLLKFEIPPDAKQPLHDLLVDFGIKESTIFPELEHLARDLSASSYGRVPKTLDNEDNPES